MWSLLYLFFILSVSYKYRTELLVYTLENMEYVRTVYRLTINNYHKKHGCPILEDINRDGIHYIKYMFMGNKYIMYLNDEEYIKNVTNGRLNTSFPYEVKEKKKNLLDLGIQSSDDIIHAFIKDDVGEVDITDFCRMLSGPHGNFYLDNPAILKATKDNYKDDLVKWLNNKSIMNYKITYIGSLGDEFHLDN